MNFSIPSNAVIHEEVRVLKDLVDALKMQHSAFCAAAKNLIARRWR